jgi:hypothetical protein
MEVDIDADKFSVIAVVQRGYRVTFSHGQTHLGRDSVLRVKQAKERLSVFHEESHWGELFVRADPRRQSWFPSGSKGSEKD